MIRPRWRITIGTLMILVAVAGGVAKAFQLRREAGRLHDRASAHRALSLKWTRDCGSLLACGTGSAAFKRQQAALGEWMTQVARHHEDLAKKYDIASQRPWLSIAPDPPEPQRPAL